MISPAVLPRGHHSLYLAYQGDAQSIRDIPPLEADDLEPDTLARSLFACSVYQDYGPMIAEERDRLPPVWQLLKSLTKLLDTQ